MKLPITCNECKATSLGQISYHDQIEIRDDFLYKIRCPEGHESATRLIEQRYEILFEIGAYAIVDGYYREAISSFTASLERYYEFFIKTALTNQSLTDEEIKKSWKNVASQSERQLGGYIFAHLLFTRRSPILLDTKLIQLRNEVIHKGKIPSRDESIKYGENVLTNIRQGVAILKYNFNDAIQEMIRQSMYPDNTDDSKVGHLSINTILNILTDHDSSEESLTAAIERIKKYRLM